MSVSSGLASYYDDLSRFEYWKKRFVMHKSFATEPSLDDWLAARIAAVSIRKLLDVGCGFGATIRQLDEIPEAHGLTISAFQKQVAERLTDVPGRQFFTGSYEEPLPDMYDGMVSVESLVFSSDLEETLSNLSRHLTAAGRLFVVEDMSVAETESPWEGPYREGFRLARVYRATDFERAFEVAGFTIEDSVDLTERLPRPARRGWSLKRRAFSALRHLAPTRLWTNVASAYWGGVYLERLYADGLFAYRFYELRKVDS